MRAFELTEEQSNSANEFISYHDCSLGEEHTTTIGGEISYTFVTTGLGCIVTISCICGENKDLTEYERF